MYAFTGQSDEFGISTKGIYNVLSPHCIVLDQQISKINIPLLLSYLMFCVHNCFLSSNCLTEFGTKFDILNIRKNACRNKHQNVAS